jgi:hypothetical protein
MEFGPKVSFVSWNTIRVPGISPMVSLPLRLIFAPRGENDSHGAASWREARGEKRMVCALFRFHVRFPPREQETGAD